MPFVAYDIDSSGWYSVSLVWDAHTCDPSDVNTCICDSSPNLQ